MMKYDCEISKTFIINHHTPWFQKKILLREGLGNKKMLNWSEEKWRDKQNNKKVTQENKNKKWNKKYIAYHMVPRQRTVASPWVRESV